MAVNALIFIGLLLLLLFLGIPVAFALGLTSIVAFINQFGLSFPTELLAQRMVYGVNNFTIIAVPFFIFAARVMNTGGVTRRLFNFSDVLVGHFPGGLGQTNILNSMIFAGMSGAAVSDAAGIGAMEIEAMNDHGYEPDFSAAVTAASSTIGPIIPPSIPMVYYAMQSGTSMGALFSGGLLPGVIMGIAMMAMVYMYAKKGKCPPPRPRPTLKEIGIAFKQGILPILTPVILLGGMYTGWFTPTEAAAITAIYALSISLFVFKEIKISELPEVIRLTIRDTAVVAFIVACTYPYAWLLTASGLPGQFVEWVTSLNLGPGAILFAINIFLLIVGCFLEGCSAILLLTPMLLPVVTQLGVDPVHFGVVMVLNLMIGLITPPFGLVLFVTARVANRPLTNVIKASIPFTIPLIVVLFLITYIPDLVLWVPRVLGML